MRGTTIKVVFPHMGGIHPREGWDFRGTTIKVVFPHMGGIHPRGWEFPWFWFAWYFGIFIPRLPVVDTGRLSRRPTLRC